MEIRPGGPGDLEQINDLYNAYVLDSPVTFDIEPIDMPAREEWFAGFDGRRYRLLVAVEGVTVVGYVVTKPFRPKHAYETTVETTVYVAIDQHGRGIGTRLYAALFDAIAGEDLHRAYAGITVPNAASFALHQRFGFKQVAYFTEQGRKFDRYWDVAWFEKALPAR